MSDLNKKNYLQLVEDINKANFSYYILGKSIITDKEYDRNLELLSYLESKHPEWKVLNSPSEKIGADMFKLDVNNEKRKIELKLPMHSLKKRYSLEEIITFFKNSTATEFAIEPKFDGLSLQLYYVNGKLSKAITRGDGLVGIDVTNSAQKVYGILKEIDYKEPLIIQGEVLVPLSYFNTLNLNNTTPRNYATGALMSLNPKEVVDKNICFIAYEVYLKDLATQMELNSFLKERGFNKFISFCNVVQSITKDDLASPKSNLFAIDGMVIKINDRSLHQHPTKIKTKYPNHAIAYKFENESKPTMLNNIDWQISRNGKFTPVGIVDPVNLSGTIITKASLSNLNNINSLGIDKLPKEIYIEKAGGVIPKIVSIVKKTGTMYSDYPKTCKHCNSEIEVSKDLELHCTNTLNCPGVLIEKIKYISSREVFGIRGLGIKNIEKIVLNNLVEDCFDIFSLTIEDLKKIFSNKLAFNIIKSINFNKDFYLVDSTVSWRVLLALDIPEVGLSKAKLISQTYKDLNKLIETDIKEFQELTSLNERISKVIVDWFKQNDLFVERVFQLFKKRG